MIDSSENFKIIFFFFFFAVKEIQRNSSRLNYRNKKTESRNSRAKQFNPAPKEGSKHAILRNSMKKKLIAMQCSLERHPQNHVITFP